MKTSAQRLPLAQVEVERPRPPDLADGHLIQRLSELYDLVLPLISRNGRFEQKALDTLAESYVDLKLLPTKPDMARTYTEQFLPK
jgi:hypothetical protein